MIWTTRPGATVLIHPQCISFPAKSRVGTNIGVLSKLPVETAKAGGLPVGGSGVAAFGTVTAAAVVLLLLVKGGDGGHRLASLATLPIRRLRCGHHDD
jgi:hypothetical protein